MAYIRPELQKKLVEVDVKTQVRATLSTIFLASVITITSAVIIGTGWAVIQSLLSSQS